VIKIYIFIREPILWRGFNQCLFYMTIWENDQQRTNISSDSFQTDTVHYCWTESRYTSIGAYKSLLDSANMVVWTEETLIGKCEANNIWEIQTYRGQNNMKMNPKKNCAWRYGCSSEYEPLVGSCDHSNKNVGFINYRNLDSWMNIGVWCTYVAWLI
jgi:hypothetical protein